MENRTPDHNQHTPTTQTPIIFPGGSQTSPQKLSKSIVLGGPTVIPTGGFVGQVPQVPHNVLQGSPLPHGHASHPSFVRGGQQFAAGTTTSTAWVPVGGAQVLGSPIQSSTHSSAWTPVGSQTVSNKVGGHVSSVCGGASTCQICNSGKVSLIGQGQVVQQGWNAQQTAWNVAGSGNISYEVKPVVKIDYVTIPVQKTEYVSMKVQEPQAKVGEDDEEIARLKRLVQEKDEMIVHLRTQNDQCAQENISLRLQFDELNQDLDNQKKEGTKKGGQGSVNPELLKDVQRLNTLLEEKSKAYDQLVEENNKSKQSYESQISQMKEQMQQLVKEYETRITTIIKEKEGADRSGELKGQIMKITTEYETRITTIIREKDAFESKLTIITKERDELLLRIAELERIIETLKIELASAKDNLLAYENKIAILSGELSRVKSMNTGKSGELDEMRTRITEYETTHSSFSMKMTQYESQIRSLMIKSDNGLALVVLLCAEIDQLRGRFIERVEN